MSKSFITLDFSDSEKRISSFQDNQPAAKLQTFLRENCEDLAENIMGFSNYKPTKKNSEILKKKSKRGRAKK